MEDTFTLNKFLLNKLKSDRVQKYVCIATNKENAKYDLYKIIISDDGEDDDDEDEMFFVHTVLTYDADIIETVFHTHFKDYKYKEYINNSANKWYLLPLEII